jgi:acetyl esterase/lipase
MKMLISLLMSMFIISSCQKGVEDGVENGTLTARTHMNVSYGSDSLQKMDVYLPAGRSKDSTKVIVLIHGGAWIEGDKRDFASFLAVLQQRLPEYAIFNINYRLASQTANHFPTQEEDVKAAMNFINSKRNEYLVSDKWVLLGASAGAHLALLQSYKYATPVKPKAVVSLFGPTDLAAMYNSSTSFYQWALSILIGGTPTGNQSAYDQSSPVFFVTAQSPPTLLLHGGSDALVPISQSVTLHAKLQQAGVTTQLVTYPNEGHGWVGANMEDSYNKIEAFIRANVR